MIAGTTFYQRIQFSYITTNYSSIERDGAPWELALFKDICLKKKSEPTCFSFTYRFLYRYESP